MGGAIVCQWLFECNDIACKSVICKSKRHWRGICVCGVWTEQCVGMQNCVKML